MFLALDLGKRTGWALSASQTTRPSWGSVDLTAGFSPRWGGIAKDGRLIVAIQRWLRMVVNHDVTEVVFEQVAFTKSLAQSHCFAELRAGVRLTCELAGIPYSGVKPQDVRTRLVGNGNAKKELVWQALADLGYRCLTMADGEPDYDASDALALLLWRTSQQIEETAT